MSFGVLCAGLSGLATGLLFGRLIHQGRHGKRKERRGEIVEVASEDSFPASDPPGYSYVEPKSA
jgi:hypothetical protein